MFEVETTTTCKIKNEFITRQINPILAQIHGITERDDEEYMKHVRAIHELIDEKIQRAFDAGRSFEKSQQK